MAIKVKHEGNVTSRIYAAAAGGKGKRQAEDAKVLLAAQQRGNGSGGGTGGGARAGGNAPTLSAPTSHATLGSTGQMLSPPSMSFNQRTQLQAQQDEAAKDRLITEQKWRSGEKKLDREHETTIKQSEIDNYNVQRDLDRKHRETLQKDELDWRAKQEQDRRQYDEQQKIIAYRREELRKQGYSEEQINNILKIDSDIATSQTNNNLTSEQKAQALKDFNDRKSAIKPLYPPQATAQQDFENSIVTDPTTGLRYRKTSRGEFELLETETSSQQREALFVLRQQQKKYDDFQKFLRSRVEDDQLLSQNEGTPFDVKTSLKNAVEAYEVIYGKIPTDPNASSNPNPNPNPAPNSATADELKNKYRD